MKNVYVFAGGVVVAAVVYAYLKTRIEVPGVIKDGIEAAGLLGGLGFNIVTDPLDAFGIRPGVNNYGVPKWQRTNWWENENDPVSNNDLGINFNYF